MDDPNPKTRQQPGPPLGREVGKKAARKLRARRRVTRTVWSGLGMIGLVGWSVAVPTLAGALAGLWLDRYDPGGRSWTLALLVAGLVIGCWNAWHWVTKEQQAIRDEPEEDDD